MLRSEVPLSAFRFQLSAFPLSTLSSSSTDAEVLAAYDDNASYEEDGSTSKAAAFITACRFLLRKPKRMAEDGAEIEYDRGLLRDELARAQAFYAANVSTGAAIHTDFSSFRT